MVLFSYRACVNLIDEHRIDLTSAPPDVARTKILTDDEDG